MTKKREFFIRLAYFAFLYVFLCIFYMKCYPLILSSPDDWRYINYWRDFAFALVGRGWNPGRVLPEVLMPLGARIGVYIVSPILRIGGVEAGFIDSVALGLALIVTASVLFYLYSFDYFIRKKLSPDIFRELFLTSFFFIAHFLIFRSSVSGNTYLFDGIVPNLYFYYIIPCLLNFSVCFFWAAFETDEYISQMSLFPQALFLTAVYFAVLSNMFSSIVIAVYAALRCLRHILKERGLSFGISISRLKYELFTLCLWLYSLAAEATGGNARNIIGGGRQRSFISAIPDSILSSFGLFKSMSKYFLLLSAVLILILMVFIIKERRIPELLVFVSLHLLIVYIYQILLAAAVGSGYISRAMVCATFLVDLILIDVYGLICLIRFKREFMIVAPIMIIIMISLCDTTAPVYTAPSCETASVKKLDEYFIEAIHRADSEGSSEVRIDIPAGYPGIFDDSNTPELYSTYISSTLYKYGITSRLINISFDSESES